MAESSWPYDAGAGASITEVQWREMARLWLPSGPILGLLNALEVFADGTGMQVKVKTGEAYVEGAKYKNDAEKILAIAAADPTNPRIDRVVLRNHFGNNVTDLQVLQGTPGASPSPPALTQSTSMWEISLAQVSVPATDTSIDASQVTDERQLVNPHNRLHAAKTADETVTNSAALQDDNQLFVYLLPGQTWVFELVLPFSGPDAADLRLALAAPAAATGRWGIVEQQGTAATVAGFGDANVLQAVIATTAVTKLVKGRIANPTNPGFLRLRWAQWAANASGTTIFTGAYLDANRVA